jgi:hypothetical protein
VIIALHTFNQRRRAERKPIQLQHQMRKEHVSSVFTGLPLFFKSWVRNLCPLKDMSIQS